MKQRRPCAAVLIAALSLCAPAGYAQSVPFDTDRWEMNANEARVEALNVPPEVLFLNLSTGCTAVTHP